MPGRTYTAAGGYRYGFNGQEKSLEINPEGNSNTAEFWQYDARLGRRWNIDPKPSVWLSPYNCFNGNPIVFMDILGDTSINGQRMEAMNAAAATTLKNVTVIGKQKGSNPLAGQSPDAYKPYAEITSILLDKNIDYAKKLDALRTPARFPQGGTLPINPTEMRSLDGELLKNIMAGATLRVLDKGFTVIDIVSIGMSSGKGSDAPLEIPFIGGLTQGIANGLVAETDEWLFESAIKRGYLYFARFMNSSPGRRSNLIGVYASEDVMLSIIRDGGLAMNKHNVLKNACCPDQSPISAPNMEMDHYKYFIFFNYENRNDDVIKNFGVLPITGQKWGQQ